jgi:hypothetical protein
MNVVEFKSSDFDLDRRIELLVGKQMRGTLDPAEKVELTRLIARRSRGMRAVRRRPLAHSL